MLDVLTKVIPWIQAYPTWLQDDRGCLIVFTAVILAALSDAKEACNSMAPETLNLTAATTGSKTSCQ